MTHSDIEQRRLRRLERRIRHLSALLKVRAIFGKRERKQTESLLRDLILRESAALWQLLHPDGEPEDLAKR